MHSPAQFSPIVRFQPKLPDFFLNIFNIPVRKKALFLLQLCQLSLALFQYLI